MLAEIQSDTFRNKLTPDEVSVTCVKFVGCLFADSRRAVVEGGGAIVGQPITHLGVGVLVHSGNLHSQLMLQRMNEPVFLL